MDGNCQECPDGAVCYGGFEMHPKAGYWRHDWQSDHFYECVIKDACLGSPGYPDETDEINWAGECETGYKGNICQVCEKDYYRLITGECEPCDFGDHPLVQAAIGIGFLVALNTVLVGILT